MNQYHALIVDDNANNTGVLSELLAQQGVDSTSLKDARNLERALDQMESIDVIFLDLELPGVDGYQVLQRLKEDPRFNMVPMVAYTVHVSEISNARNLGFDSFLGKPLDADRFPEQLERIMRGEQVWA